MSATQTTPLAEVHPAEIVNDTAGFDVIDTRDGRTLAWRGSSGSAYAIAAMLNTRYPENSIPPAWDTLVDEIVAERIRGEVL